MLGGFNIIIRKQRSDLLLRIYFYILQVVESWLTARQRKWLEVNYTGDIIGKGGPKKNPSTISLLVLSPT